jgi:hypothetical protein
MEDYAINELFNPPSNTSTLDPHELEKWRNFYDTYYGCNKRVKRERGDARCGPAFANATLGPQCNETDWCADVQKESGATSIVSVHIGILFALCCVFS